MPLLRSTLIFPNPRPRLAEDVNSVHSAALHGSAALKVNPAPHHCQPFRREYLLLNDKISTAFNVDRDSPQPIRHDSPSD